MFDTNLVIMGNVLNAPEWRRIQGSGSLVAKFRVASTSRRYDRANGCWVDGNQMRIRVVAWRRLAEGVAASISVGDPVIVYGRVYTREWRDENGNNRTGYELEAFSIGHDLSRGRARFVRVKPGPEAGTAEDAEALVAGELTDPVSPDEIPVEFGDGLPDRFTDVGPVVAGEEAEPEPTIAEETEESVTAPSPVTETPADVPSPEGSTPAGGDELDAEVERLVAETPPAAARRTRRTRKEPVAA